MLMYKLLINEEQGITVGSLYNHPEIFKIMLGLGDKESLKLLVKEQIPICYIYRGDTSQETHSHIITPKDMEEIINKKISQRDLVREFLACNVDVINETLPQEIERGVILKNVEQKEDSIIYTASLDEDLYDVIVFDKIKSELKNGILSNLSQTKSNRRFLRQLIECNMNLIYRYCGDVTGTTINVVIGGKDMKESFGKSMY